MVGGGVVAGKGGIFSCMCARAAPTDVWQAVYLLPCTDTRPVKLATRSLRSCRCACIDGDADRLVYFMDPSASGAVTLLDGDKIAALLALLVQKLLAAAGLDDAKVCSPSFWHLELPLLAGGCEAQAAPTVPKHAVCDLQDCQAHAG